MVLRVTAPMLDAWLVQYMKKAGQIWEPETLDNFKLVL